MSHAEQTDRLPALPVAAPPRAGSGAGRAAIAADAAASALGPGDRLLAPHGWFTANGIGPQSPPAIAVGVALGIALGPAGRTPGAALALVDRRWAAHESCEAALALARELGLGLVVVAIDRSRRTEHEGETVDRDDPVAVASAVARSLDEARQGRRAALIECAARGRPRLADPPGRWSRGGERWR